MTMKEVTDFLDRKLVNNKKKVIFTFYEIRISLNLSKEETEEFVRLSKTRLENLGYKVFLTGQKYIYEDKCEVVPINQIMVAIKK